MRTRDYLMRILKGNQNYIVYKVIKQNDRKKKMSLKNALMIAWDFPCSFESHFHLGMKLGRGMKLWGRRGLLHLRLLHRPGGSHLWYNLNKLMNEAFLLSSEASWDLEGTLRH